MSEFEKLGTWALDAVGMLAKVGGLLFIAFLVGNFVTYWQAIRDGRLPPP